MWIGGSGGQQRFMELGPNDVRGSERAIQRRRRNVSTGVRQMEPSADAVKTGLTTANCLNHIRNNRIEYLIVTMLMYSIGALDKGIEYATGICM